MANARHQQTKKSYQQKDRTTNVSDSIPRGSPSNPSGGAFAKELPNKPKYESGLAKPSTDRVEVGTRAIEAVEALAEKLNSDGVPPTPLQFERSYRLKCRTARALLVVQKDLASPISGGTITLAVPQMPELQSDSTASFADDEDTNFESIESESNLDSGDAWSSAVDSKLNELLERAKTFERERLEIEALRENIQQAIATAESSMTSEEVLEQIQLLEAELVEASEMADDANARIQSLEIQLSDASLTSDDRKARIEALEKQSAEACSMATDANGRMQSLEKQLADTCLTSEGRGELIKSLKMQLADACTSSQETKARIQELETQLIEAQQESTKVSTILLHARAEYQELLAFIEAEAVEEGESQAELKTIAQRVLEKADARETELGLEVSPLNDQIQFLQGELDEAKTAKNHSHSDESELRIQVEQLRSQLLEARHEAVELRMQSNDLGSRLAKYQGASTGQKSETLTWEQRKEALLQQLEAETHAEAPCDPRKVLEIEKVIEQTNSEIERRDQEIADLKTLIEQQSIAHDGMSIGVSAIAEMIESDSLIVSERLRLKELRDEWEQKQRQAEIEMSMERAKLARERLELQEKTRSYNDDNPPQTAEEINTSKASKRGRWLARLGLRDE